MSDCQRLVALVLPFTLLCGSIAQAQESGSVTVSAQASPAGAQAAASGRAVPAPSPEPRDDKYGPPWGTDPLTGELGLYWGAFIPSSKHELYDADRRSILFQKLERVTPELGVRAAFFPLRVLGLEVEGALLPSQTRKSSGAVNLFSARGHLILQLPTKTIVPFILGGGGLLGISSDNDVLGSDIDGELHAGVGVKAYVSSDLALRLDVRDTFSQGLGKDTIAQHWEVLLGLSIIVGRPKPPPPPADTDGDGVVDPNDQCPDVAGVPPTGCPPPPPPDSDGDGFLDADDKCPNEPGVASSDPAKHGCPPPPPDGDGDGVPDSLDKCPTVAGDGPDGCLLDTDGDGFPNRDDKCPEQPETRNGFEDSDGCPDEIPKAVQKFTGVIPGIAFETGKATIKPSSYPTLDEAARVLNEYQDLRVEISGHTDSTGTLERNLVLSGERAAAVKTYLSAKGIGNQRIYTRGAGPNEPVADNATKEGKSKNRRIEFKLLLPDQQPSVNAATTTAPVPDTTPPAPPAP